MTSSAAAPTGPVLMRRMWGIYFVMPILTVLVMGLFGIAVPAIIESDPVPGVLLAIVVVLGLVLAVRMPLVGYRLGGRTIAVREGLLLQWSDTSHLANVRAVSWHMGSLIPGLQEGFVLWTTKDVRTARLHRRGARWVTRPGVLDAVAELETSGRPLHPFLVTTSGLRRGCREMLLDAVRREGFAGVPERPRDAHGELSLRAAQT